MNNYLIDDTRLPGPEEPVIATILRQALENLQYIKQTTHAKIHPKIIQYTSRYTRVGAPGHEFGDTVEDLWNALPREQTHNLFALVGDVSEEIEVEGPSQVNFGAVAFIKDAKYRGWHVILLDNHRQIEPYEEGHYDVTD